MKIVVIGGHGRIGSKLVEQLEQQGHDAVAADLASGVNTLTGEGLPGALDGARVVVDVSNSPSFADAAVLEFFQTSTGNLMRAEQAAGVEHHVALSVVGADRLPDSGYLRAKVVQEQLIRDSSIPYSIVPRRSSSSSSTTSPMPRPKATPFACRRRSSSRWRPATWCGRWAEPPSARP